LKWNEYFEIKERYIEDGDLGTTYMYDLIIKSTNIIVASYKDESYAKKQAKYKFKKITNRVEKLLLG
jgi:hypothetical protein